MHTTARICGETRRIGQDHASGQQESYLATKLLPRCVRTKVRLVFTQKLLMSHVLILVERPHRDRKAPSFRL
jgi:hypothetical protein